MRDIELKLIIGSLVHDIGKVLYRANDGRNHSVSGYEFLRDEVGISDSDILDQVHYHHAGLLKGAKLKKNSLSYITYIADNISSFSDRRDNGTGETGFEKDMALESIFNILNGNHGNMRYQPKTLSRDSGINMPTKDEVVFDQNFYQEIRDNIKDILSHLEFKDTYINSLLETLEANLTYIPSSTSRKEVADVSLFDHMKLTAAISCCILQYLEEKGVADYQSKLFLGAKEFYAENAFLLYSMDISGIQAFIYQQYGNKNVLKNLRARSFYLEIMLENMVDDILDLAGLSRANLIYSGGGHAYILMPNTEALKEKLEAFEKRMNQWFLDEFKADLYVACGYAECSANALRNNPAGSYRDIFGRVSKKISDKKVHRYSAQEIITLNRKKPDDNERECRICHRSDHLVGEDLCEICDGLIKLSNDILHMEFFTILSSKDDISGIPIGPERYLVADTEKKLRERMKNQPEYIRAYCKNKMYVGDSIATKLWVGDYCAAGTLEELVNNGKGIKRLGVIRADIDNLGQAFVQGFTEEYQTLSRAATFSRKLSLFFKLHINDILENAIYSMDGVHNKRQAAIIYSGGDDVFIVGAWKDVIEFAMDLHDKLKEFSEDTLTISAGIGLYYPKYPISYMASQTGELEDFSKDLEGKNAIDRKSVV